MPALNFSLRTTARRSRGPRSTGCSPAFYAAPDDALYAQLQVAVTEAPTRGAFLERSWAGVVATSRRLTLDEVRDEYAALFLGIGKPEVFLYGSFFIAGSLNGKPLVDLRSDLGALGLERPEAVSETEDHIASLCEVMRSLIAGDDLSVSNLANHTLLQSPSARLGRCAVRALEAHPRSGLLSPSGRLHTRLHAVEVQGFELLDA